MGSRGRDSYGKAGREAAATVDAIATLVDGFDPDRVLARDALDLVSEFSRLEHLASAGVALAARRVAQTELWRQGGHSSPAHWLSHLTGMSVGEAIGLLETAEVVEAAPDTFEALKAGAVSTRQARAIGAAETADPDAGRRLLDAAEQRSTKETTDAAARIVRAASTESETERMERHRRQRRICHAIDADGMGVGWWKLPIAEHLRFVSRLEAEQGQVFAEARAAGVREPAEAYAADAFCRILDRAPGPDRVTPSATTSSRATDVTSTAGGEKRVVEDWSFVKAIVRVDLTALDRGEVAPGEVCEVAGRGPIPVADAWKMIDGGAFVAAITTKGTEIDKVIHLGRKPTVLQKTALEWLSAGECSIEGCTSPARIEIDHVADWAHTKTTTLAELATPCGHHHDLKTHHRYTFGPRLPSGKRKLLPPDAAASNSTPTDDTGAEAPARENRPHGTGVATGALPPDTGPPPTGSGPPDLTLIPSQPSNEPTRQQLHTHRQGDLFDTG